MSRVKAGILIFGFSLLSSAFPHELPPFDSVNMNIFRLMVQQTPPTTILLTETEDLERQILKIPAFPTLELGELEKRWKARGKHTRETRGSFLVEFEDKLLVISSSSEKAFLIPKEKGFSEFMAVHGFDTSVFYFMNPAKQIQMLSVRGSTGGYFWHFLDISNDVKSFQFNAEEYAERIKENLKWRHDTQQLLLPFAKSLFGPSVLPGNYHNNIEELKKRISLRPLSEGLGADLLMKPLHIERSSKEDDRVSDVVSKAVEPVQYLFNFGDKRSPISARRTLNRKGEAEIRYIIPYSGAKRPAIEALEKELAQGAWISFPEGASGIYYFIPRDGRMDESLIQKMKTAMPNSLDPEKRAFQVYRSLFPQLEVIPMSERTYNALRSGEVFPEDGRNLLQLVSVKKAPSSCKAALKKIPAKKSQ